jgi:hypothetical protein
MLIGLTIMVGAALVGCGGGVTKEKAEKVYKDYYSAVLKAAKDGKEIKSEEAMNKAAKDNGFTDWKDFSTKATTALGADGWKEVVDNVTKWYTEENKKMIEEKTKAATDKAKEGAKEEGK